MSSAATLDLASIPERVQSEVQRAIQRSIKGVEYFSTIAFEVMGTEPSGWTVTKRSSGWRPAVVIWPGTSQARIAAPHRPKLSPSRWAPPELARPWVCLAPGVDDAARLGVIEVMR